ncbi:hypothetical protein [Rhodovulum sp. MB263]|uniref:hypothetical protein n=1 Tax=Rhodovulum sp. (strain MB263) TaxID=308754 RepID=UPI0012DB6E40|nr:hypothetical protein [Rhodovulum sp. MB263]
MARRTDKTIPDKTSSLAVVTAGNARKAQRVPKANWTSCGWVFSQVSALFQSIIGIAPSL